MITAPITTPIVAAMGYNEIWFGVIFVMNMQMAYISPPFGYNLFYIKSVAPGTPMREIYLAIIPFIILQAIGLIIVAIFPQITFTDPYRDLWCQGGALALGVLVSWALNAVSSMAILRMQAPEETKTALIEQLADALDGMSKGSTLRTSSCP